MKKITTLLLSTHFITIILAQDTVDVVEKTIKISGTSTEREYYGFAEGDKVIFSLVVENKKELKNTTISEYPNNIKFAEHTTQKVENKILNIHRTSVYLFEYHNSNLAGRAIKTKIQRIPKSEQTKFFNTNIKWVNKIDTTYFAREKTYLSSSDTSIVEVTDARIRVHSQTNLDNPNKTIVDFVIPATPGESL